MKEELNLYFCIGIMFLFLKRSNLFLKKFKFILSILRERVYGGGEERERIPSRLCAVSAEPNVGLKPMNREVMT